MDNIGKLETRFANDEYDWARRKKITNMNQRNYGVGGTIGTEYDTPTNGLFQVYWPGPDKQLRYEWYYKDGKRDGVSKGWTSTGKLKQMRNWTNGEEISKKEWNGEGELL